MAEVGAGITLTLPNISARYWNTERGFFGVDALPEGGYITIIEKAISASGANLRLQQEVAQIQQDGDSVTVSTLAGEKFTAPYVSVANTAVSSLGR
jgi:monoamine oxidase